MKTEKHGDKYFLDDDGEIELKIVDGICITWLTKTDLENMLKLFGEEKSCKKCRYSENGEKTRNRESFVNYNFCLECCPKCISNWTQKDGKNED